jgi:hypothetical protein
MVADALTKSLPGLLLTQHREVMLGHAPFYARLLHLVPVYLLLPSGETPSKCGG